MRRRWAPLFVFFLAIGAGLGSTKSMAMPVLNAAIVVQICQALLNKVPGQLPAIVQRQAGEDFVERYGPYYYPMPLDGCLSAVETGRASTSETTFLLQHIRYESYWEFWFDGESIKYIKITRFRPVTLAGDEPWQESDRSVTPPHRYAALTRNEWTPGQNDDPRVVEFFYATNRKKSADPERLEKSTLITDDGAHDSNGWRPISGYSGERSPDLNFGAVRVRIPDTHRIGRIELASNVKIFGLKFSSDDTEPSKHFIIRGIEETNAKPRLSLARRLDGNNGHLSADMGCCDKLFRLLVVGPAGSFDPPFSRRTAQRRKIPLSTIVRSQSASLRENAEIGKVDSGARLWG